MTDPSTLTLRRLDTREDYEACVRLQRDIWGPDFLDVVPATILMVSQKVGGVNAGAFDTNGRLLGFVFGISGVRNGELAHWSDMLAVRRDTRGAGVGKRLKLLQRDLLLNDGITVAYWTYDPLVARNANLNLNSLGALPVEYVANMYGETQSGLHAGLDTDRFVVVWRLDDPRVEQTLNDGGTKPPPAAIHAPSSIPTRSRETPRTRARRGSRRHHGCGWPSRPTSRRSRRPRRKTPVCGSSPHGARFSGIWHTATGWPASITPPSHGGRRIW